MILVVDNYDSFTFNLVQALAAADAPLVVRRNDRIDRAGVEELADAHGGARLAGIVISPGPGDPAAGGVSIAAVEVAAARGLPLLGVCLGHQCLAAAFGGSIVRAPTLVHGESSAVEHDGQGLLHGLANPFEAARYHSLCVDESSLPAVLAVTARTREGVVMGIRHRELPLEGVQFHPESVLTPEGPRLLANFLRLTGVGDPGLLDDAAAGGFARHGLSGARGGRFESAGRGRPLPAGISMAAAR